MFLVLTSSREFLALGAKWPYKWVKTELKFYLIHFYTL